MSCSNELKVGEVVSYETDNPALEGDWYCVSIKDIDTLHDFRASVVAVGRNWQRGIHKSLLPDGWQIVPIEPTDKMVIAANCAMNPIKADIHPHTKAKRTKVWKAMLKATT